MIRALPGERLCGKGRTEDAIYLESGVSPQGKPLEEFLVDVPKGFDVLMHGISSIGVKLFQDDHGIWHVIDRVGTSHYASPADFLEEARRMGFSRKVSATLDFSKLGPGSQFIFVHDRGLVSNAAAFVEHDFLDAFLCPCGKRHLPSQGCTGLHWYDGIHGHNAGLIAGPPYAGDWRLFGGDRGRLGAVSAIKPYLPGDDGMLRHSRKLAGGGYGLLRLSPHAPKAEFTPAIIASVPITAISLTKASNGAVDDQKLAKVMGSRVPVFKADA
jgi:hypothetical protein